MSKKNVHPIISGAGWIASFSELLIEELGELGVSFDDIHKLGKPTNEGRALVRACAEKISEMVNERIKNEFLKLISGGESLIIDECDGSEILANASDMFIWIDPDFINYGVDKKGPVTGKTPVRVHEMTKDSTFAQMFGSLFGAFPDGMEIAKFVEQYRSNLRKLCFTQAQIKGFVKKYRNWLRTDGYATFFLFPANNRFFVVDVSVDADGKLYVRVRRLESSYVWDAPESRHRVVVPATGLTP